MCVVAWAESALHGRNTYHPPKDGTVTIRHVTEILSYDFAARTVRIRLMLLPVVATRDPVFIHCLHRRDVVINDETAQLLDVNSPIARLAETLRLILRKGPCKSGLQVVLRVESRESIGALIPERIEGVQDLYCNVPSERRAELPYSSICFGPLEPSATPYLLALTIKIEGDTFERLITILRNHISRFLYSIEGPDIISRDIEPLDLLGAAQDIRNSYRGPLSCGVQKCRSQIESYDIITCDAPTEHADYVRLISKVQESRIGEEVVLDGQRCLVNSWHSDKTDFLIQRVSFSST